MSISPSKNTSLKVFRIVLIEEDQITVEYSEDKLDLKRFGTLQKNEITESLQLNQIVALHVKTLGCDQFEALNMINSPNDLEYHKQLIQSQLNAEIFEKGMKRISKGEVNHLDVEALILLAASEEQYANFYPNLRSMLLLQEAEEIKDHIEQQNHSIACPKFLRLCKTFLHSLAFEEQQNQINVSEFLSVKPIAEAFIQSAAI